MEPKDFPRADGNPMIEAVLRRIVDAGAGKAERNAGQRNSLPIAEMNTDDQDRYIGCACRLHVLDARG